MGSLTLDGTIFKRVRRSCCERLAVSALLPIWSSKLTCSRTRLLSVASMAVGSDITTSRESTPTEPIYLFWEERKKQWVFGPNLGSSSKVEFGSNANSLAKCPADPPATGKWQYKSSVLSRWK